MHLGLLIPFFQTLKILLGKVSSSRESSQVEKKMALFVTIILPKGPTLYHTQNFFPGPGLCF